MGWRNALFVLAVLPACEFEPDPLPLEATVRATIRTGSADTYVDQVRPYDDVGTMGYALVGFDIHTRTERAALLSFPALFTADIPDNAYILQATLHLYVTGTSSEGVSSRITRAEFTWDEGANWLALSAFLAPSGEHAPAIVSTQPTTVEQSLTIDVTQDLQDWSHGAANDGWLFLPQGEGIMAFATGEASANQPRLEVTYIPAPPR